MLSRGLLRLVGLEYLNAGIATKSLLLIMFFQIVLQSQIYTIKDSSGRQAECRLEASALPKSPS